MGRRDTGEGALVERWGNVKPRYIVSVFLNLSEGGDFAMQG